jgi:hypothetical protein
MVPGGMGTDPELFCNGGIGLSAGQELRDLKLTASETIAALQRVPICARAVEHGGRAPRAELASELPHLMDGAPELTDQRPAVLTNGRALREEIEKPICIIYAPA